MPSVPASGQNWNANWCSQPSIHTFWTDGSTGTACGDYAQLHICVTDTPQPPSPPAVPPAPPPPPPPASPPLPPLPPPAACEFLGQKQGNDDWSCAAGYRMPTQSEYSLVAPCVPAGFAYGTYTLGVAHNVSGCGCVRRSEELQPQTSTT